MMAMLGVRDLIFGMIMGSLLGCGVCAIAIQLCPRRAETRAAELWILGVWVGCLGFFILGVFLLKVYEAQPATGLRGMLWRGMAALDILLKGDEAVAAWCADGEA